MNLDELFDQAARVGEPGLPADVLGGVRRAQAQRRRRQLIAVPVACVTIAAAVLVPTLLVQRDAAAPSGPATAPPTPSSSPTPRPAAPAPTVMVGIDGARAVRVDLATRTRTDLGAARAVTLHAGAPWLSRRRAACADTIVSPIASFDARGEVPALEVSPDGTTLAYVREAGPVSTDYPDMLCGSRSLVLRDIASGVERSWSADDGSLRGLAWSADSRRLGFTFRGCCGDDDPDVRVLDATAAPSDVYGVPEVPAATGTCMNYLPVFSGETLLLVVRCFDTQGSASEDFALKDASTGALIMALDANTYAVTADASGQHLLVSASTGADGPDTVYLVRPRDQYVRELSEVLSNPHW